MNWTNWYLVASGVPGVVPNQNPIESHHRSLKKSGIRSLRVSTAGVLNEVLPAVMIHAVNLSEALQSFGHFCESHLLSECVVTASHTTMNGNFRYLYQGRGQARVVHAVLFNSSKYISHGKNDGNLNTMRVTTTRARVFQASLAGTLKKNATTITLHVDYLSLHQVQVLDRQITIDHDVTEPIWTKREITQVRNKYQCTCCNQFVTGWTCPHVLACLALLEKFPLSTTTQHLPVRKPPRRPRKIPRPLVRDDTTTAFFEVDNLIELLLSKPSRLLKFPVLIEKETTKENVPGVVSTWLNQNGVYKWNVTLSDGSTRLLECQELADAIHFANTTGMVPQ